MLLISPTSVHADPFQDSTTTCDPGEGATYPAIHKAAVLVVPAAAVAYLAVFKSATSVHVLPFQFSALAALVVPVYPPKYIVAVCVPEPCVCPLEVLISVVSVQLEPSQDSTLVP